MIPLNKLPHYKKAAEEGQSTTPAKKPAKKQPSRWHRYRHQVMLVLILVVVAVVAGCSWWFLLRQVIIPDVEGQTPLQAEQRLKKQSLRVGNITRVHDQNVAKNHIISMQPGPSAKTRVNSNINLKVSTGVSQLKMGRYIGRDYEETAKMLRQKGFRVHRRMVYSDTVDAGMIMKQNYRKGTIVKPNNSIIDFEVSAGKQNIKIPDFTNQDVSVVQQFANKHNLQLTTQQKKSKTIATNHVISQTPKAGMSLNHGDTLTVTIANSGNQTKTTNIQINIPFDGNGGQRENRVQVYIRDANHNMTMEYQDITINQETTINVPFTLKNGQMGAYRVVRNGRTIMSATNITG